MLVLVCSLLIDGFLIGFIVAAIAILWVLFFFRVRRTNLNGFAIRIFYIILVRSQTSYIIRAYRPYIKKEVLQMKKRLFSLFLSLVIVLAYCSCALAMQDSAEPLATARVYGGLSPSGSGGRYELWGRIDGVAADYLSIRVELRSEAGSYITGTSQSGQGPSVTASKYVTLSSGTYYVYLYGETPSHSPSDVVTVVI